MGDKFELKNCVSPSDFSNGNINRYSQLTMNCVLIYVYVKAYIDRIRVMVMM